MDNNKELSRNHEFVYNHKGNKGVFESCLKLSFIVCNFNSAEMSKTCN